MNVVFSKETVTKASQTVLNILTPITNRLLYILSPPFSLGTQSPKRNALGCRNGT